MYEQGGNLVKVVEDKAVSPGNDRACEGAMGKTIAGDPHGRVGRSDPKIDQVQDRAIIA